MSTFDYLASELFAARGRLVLAAVVMRYAVEELPPKAVSSGSLEVSGERYNARQIRAQNESGRCHYPLGSRTMMSRWTSEYRGAIRQDIHAVSAGSILLVLADSHISKEQDHAFE